MGSFKIVIEETHKYKKDNLHVLVFRDGDRYGLDVTNKTSSFGRITLDEKEQMKYLFSVLNDFISEQKEYLDVCQFVSSILSYDTYEEIIIVIHTYRRKIEKMEMNALIKMLGFERDDAKMSGGTHIVKIHKRNDDNVFGEFISILETGKYLFHFF
jgi:hypothetical protein